MGPLGLNRLHGVLTLLGGQSCSPPPSGRLQLKYGDCRLGAARQNPGGQCLTTAGKVQVSRQALQAAAKKDLLVLKGGLAVNFLEIRPIETAFLLTMHFYH